MTEFQLWTVAGMAAVVAVFAFASAGALLCAYIWLKQKQAGVEQIADSNSTNSSI